MQLYLEYNNYLALQTNNFKHYNNHNRVSNIFEAVSGNSLPDILAKLCRVKKA